MTSSDNSQSNDPSDKKGIFYPRLLIALFIAVLPLVGFLGVILIMFSAFYLLVNKEYKLALDIIRYGLIGVAVLVSFMVVENKIKEYQAKIDINKVEEKAEQHPNEPKLAWDLARIKLESYLDRNLAHIRWIFFLTLIVMFVGFTVIGYGITIILQPEAKVEAGIITVISGVVIQFIGATFLVIYKSTMAQAKDYVNVLERINAVGMSVQIAETIIKDENLQEQTKAELAKQLLELYASKKQI